MRSWKTTTAGIAIILLAILPVLLSLVTGEGVGDLDTKTLITQIMLGFGLIFSRDNDVSSESAGAK